MHAATEPPTPPHETAEAALARADLADLERVEARALRTLRRWGWASVVSVAVLAGFSLYTLGPTGLIFAGLAMACAAPPLFFVWIPYDQARSDRARAERRLEGLPPTGES